MTSTSELVLGVDGGGTKTVAWLALLHDDVAARPLGRGQAGPGNPRAVGFAVAQANIARAIEAAFAEAKREREPVAAACLCLSGAGRRQEQERLEHWAAETRLSQVTQVTGDAEPVLAAAAPDQVGVALISGTGSLAWGRNREGRVARSGGWGYLIGDEGSAYWIALQGLRAAVQAADGRAAATELLARYQQRLDAPTPQDIIERVYGADMTRERLAWLAAEVFAAAPTDSTAAHILAAAAEELAKMVAALIPTLNLPCGGYPLGLAGSLLLEQPAFAELVVSRLQQLHVAPGAVQRIADPVQGAVRMARKLAETTASSSKSCG